MAVYDLENLIAETCRLSADSRCATAKSLAVSSEIAKYDTCVQLRLEPVNKDEAGGYDAIGRESPWKDQCIQVNGRAFFDDDTSGSPISCRHFQYTLT